MKSVALQWEGLKFPPGNSFPGVIDMEPGLEVLHSRGSSLTL